MTIHGIDTCPLCKTAMDEVSCPNCGWFDATDTSTMTFVGNDLYLAGETELRWIRDIALPAAP